VLAEDWAHYFFGAHEVDPNAELARSKDGPANFWFGGLVGTHGIYNDVDWHLGRRRAIGKDLAGFLDGKDFAALVGSTLAASAVWQLALVAVGALGDAGGGEEVVAAALRGALLGMTPFWIRHCCIPSRCFEILESRRRLRH